MRSFEDGFRAFIETEARNRTSGDLFSLAFGHPASPEGKPFGGLPTTVNKATTILYIGGSILVLADVLLITKRRMNAED